MAVKCIVCGRVVSNPHEAAPASDPKRGCSLCRLERTVRHIAATLPDDVSGPLLENIFEFTSREVFYGQS